MDDAPRLTRGLCTSVDGRGLVDEILKRKGIGAGTDPDTLWR